ncbi:MAG: DUF6155 family protein [Bacteroidales bacterium]
MGRRDLKKYIVSLTKEQLADLLEDLYLRFNDVKTYFDFAFNPKETEMVEECKQKIAKEYFPEGDKKPKMRRSVAKKYISHFKKLNLDGVKIADVMLFNIETAQSFSAEKQINRESFYKSMFKSFEEAVEFVKLQGFESDFKHRILKIVNEAIDQNWFNNQLFNKKISNLFPDKFKKVTNNS